MAARQGSGAEPQEAATGLGPATKPVRKGGAGTPRVSSRKPPEGDHRRAAREKRAKEVRRRYDFSVIRTLRQQRNLTIEQFARLCGLSYAPISRIETNLIKPNLETLDKIASGLGLCTYNLVAMAERRDASTQGVREYRSGGFRFQLVSSEGIELCMGEGKADAVATDPDIHGRDLATLAVRRGALEITLNDKRFVVREGEAISFDCVFPHRYQAREDVEFVAVSHSRR